MGIFGQEESINKKETTLIEFLYKDSNLINSFYSQIFGGNLNNIIKTEMSIDESSNTGGINFVNVAKLGNTKKYGMNETISANYDPLDDKVLKLIESFELTPVKLSESKTGTIIATKGNLIFRHYDSLNKILPFMESNNLIPEFNDPINPGTKGKKALTIGKLITKMFNLLPYGLEFEILTSDNENAICILKDNFLTINSNDLLRAYGTNIPDEWTIIGIIDTPVKIPKKSKNHFKSAIDDATNMFASMTFDNKSTIIRPIAIYRKLTL